MRKGVLLALVALFVLSINVQAGTFPNKNISIVLGASPGGPTDLTVRALVDCIPNGVMPAGIGFTIINMPGGSGLVAANRVISSAKDAYTLGIINIDLLNNMVRKYTEITLDQYVPLVFTQADPYLILVDKRAPYKTFKELVEYIKANPGEVVFGDSGIASSPHLAIVAMEKALGLDIIINGYDNNLASTVAVMNGEANVSVAHASAAIGYLQSGDVIPLAVTSPERLSLFPDVPGMGEVYPGELAEVRTLSAVCVAGLAGANPEDLEFLRSAFLQSIKTEKFNRRLETLQSQPINITTPQQMNEFFAAQIEFLKTQM
jgi:tripartite-type tricarboxylate transporter receptor subunit TctC